MRFGLAAGVGAVVVSWLLLGSPAFAGAEQWAQGVSAADQDKANALVTEGNALVSTSPAAALEKYEAAIQIWDNPVFRYRTAIVLMQLGRDDDARGALKASLRFGAAPFTPDDYTQATSYQQMLDEKLHAGDQVYYERRFPRWIPWSVLGVSALSLVGGIAFDVVATNDMNAYDQRVASACAVNGCNFSNPQTPQEQALVDELNAQRDKAETRHTIAYVMLGVGATALVTGVVLTLLNRPHAVRVDAHATAGGAAASLTWDF